MKSSAKDEMNLFRILLFGILFFNFSAYKKIGEEIDMGKINQNRINANKNSRFNPYIFTVILGIIGAAIIIALIISLL